MGRNKRVCEEGEEGGSGMSRRMYPTRMCISCKHVVDIEEDVCGRDYITCECDECEYEDVRGREEG